MAIHKSFSSAIRDIRGVVWKRAAEFAALFLLIFLKAQGCRIDAISQACGVGTVLEYMS
jgi:hypothetical protein